MIIDLVLESGIAFGVSTRLTFEHNRTAVRKDEASPDEENARLSERDLTVVYADQLTCLHDVFRGGTLQLLVAHGTFVDRPVEECELAILHVLERVGIDRRLFARDLEWSAWRWRC